MAINNIRIVNMPCIECRRMLKFRIRDDVVVEGEGRIACNVPGAVCPDCMESLLDRVADPPGLLCVEGLSPVMVHELQRRPKFLLPRQEAVEFFKRLFPEAKKTKLG